MNENVVSLGDNVILMRMNSRADLALLEPTVAGKLVPSPTLARFGPRWSAEGGADLPTDWAAGRG